MMSRSENHAVNHVKNTEEKTNQVGLQCISTIKNCYQIYNNSISMTQSICFMPTCLHVWNGVILMAHI